MADMYMLDERGQPMLVTDVLTWGQWLEEDERRIVRHQAFVVNGREIEVSTVFLGLDHSFFGGPPVLWETRVFGKDIDWQRRYTSREAAIEGHDEAVEEFGGPRARGLDVPAWHRHANLRCTRCGVLVHKTAVCVKHTRWPVFLMRWICIVPRSMLCADHRKVASGGWSA